MGLAARGMERIDGDFGYTRRHTPATGTSRDSAAVAINGDFMLIAHPPAPIDPAVAIPTRSILKRRNADLRAPWREPGTVCGAHSFASILVDSAK
jgi:hypothetical protein